MNIHQNNKLSSKRGFSLIEVSVVLGIVSIGILGVFSLVMQNIKVQRTNKNILVASMLAQEGIELVRNVRDTNWLEGDDWDEDIAGWSNYDFAVDYVNGLFNVDDTTPNDITDTPEARLYLTPNDYYTHSSSGNTATPFYRLLKAEDMDATGDLEADYYIVTSKVQWKENGSLKDYTAVTYLYNWR